MFDRKQTLIALAQGGFIPINTEINGDLVHRVHDSLLVARAAGVSKLTIEIKSDGGSVRAGLDIYDMIRTYPGTTTGIVSCYARSMGAVILQACERRLCYRHSWILIHYVSTNNVALDALKDKKRLASAIKLGEMDQQMLDRIFADRTKKTVATIRRTCARDTDMNAEEALMFGLIDEII